MITVSELTGKTYNNEDCYFFRNTLQSAFYVHHGAPLVDIFVDDNMHFVFVFKKSDHHRLKMLWQNSDIERRENSNGN